MAKSDQAINTRIAWNHQPLCWIDDRHVVLLQENRLNLTGEPPPRAKGLYLLDVTNPQDLQRLDLSPLPMSTHEEIEGVSCQGQSIVFYRRLPGSKVIENYAMQLGNPPELISQGGQVSLTGQYLLLSRPAVPGDDNRQGRIEEHEDCHAQYLKPGFTRHCWDFFPGLRWPLAKAVLTEYRWEDMLTIRTDGGRVKKKIPNPTKPLIGKDGNPVLYGLYLHDLSGNIQVSLDEDPKFRPRGMYGASLSANEEYLYAPCRERISRTDEIAIVCRYVLDGKPHDWEEVFRIDGLEQFKGSGIPMISVSNTGDVYFPKATPRWSIWRFEAGSRKIEELTFHSPECRDEYPSVSPNSKWILFVRTGKEGANFMLLQGGAK